MTSFSLSNLPLPGLSSSGATTAMLPPVKKKPVMPALPSTPAAPTQDAVFASGTATPPSGTAAFYPPPMPQTQKPAVMPAIPEIKPQSPSPGASVGGANLKSGLSAAQVTSISNLSKKPADQWTDIDKKNWAYATNGAAIPGASTPKPPVMPSLSTPNPQTPDVPAPPKMQTPGQPQGPATPALPAASALSDAEKAYQDSLKISPDELSTQEDLDKLLESAKKAYVNAEDQAIPLQFITGQIASIERRANALAEPLQAKLARLQAQRQSSIEASKFALSRADQKEAEAKAEAKAKAAAAAEAEKPMEVGGNIVKFNPATGKYETVYEAPTKAAEGFTLSEGQRRYDANGKLIAAGAEKPGDVRESGGYLYERQSDGSWQVVGGSGPSGGSGTGKIVNINGTDYMQNPDGTFSVPNVPGGGSAGSAQVNALQDKVKLIDSLLTSKGLNGSVGPYGIARWTLYPDKAEREEFAAGVNQLIGQETIDTLLNLKKQGGTLGALSNEERIMLQTAASKIGSWMIRDKDGNPTGKFEISEEAFKKELNRIKELTQKAIQEAGGARELDASDPQVQYMREQGLKDDEIKKILGFNQDPGKSVKGPDVKKVAAAIGQFESGGNYRAVGPVTNSGDRAYGKYQIMGVNIPAWSKEVLGQSITVGQFLANPALQDQIAMAKIGQYIQRYGTVEDAASMWFSGRPLARAGNARDVIGTTVPQYARNVRAIHDRMA